MFDLPSDFYTVMDFFSFAIAVVAFLFARKAFNQASALRARLDQIEALASLAAAARPAPPPLPVQQAPVAPSAAPEARIETTEPIASRVQPAPPPPIPEITAAASQPGPGFAARIATLSGAVVGVPALSPRGVFLV